MIAAMQVREDLFLRSVGMPETYAGRFPDCLFRAARHGFHSPVPVCLTGEAVITDFQSFPTASMSCVLAGAFVLASRFAGIAAGASGDRKRARCRNMQPLAPPEVMLRDEPDVEG